MKNLQNNATYPTEATQRKQNTQVGMFGTYLGTFVQRHITDSYKVQENGGKNIINQVRGNVQASGNN